MTTNLWTILVATIGQRNAKFLELMEKLLPLTEPYHGSVKVLAYWNNGERPLSHIRQALVEQADSNYVSFVDDDDKLPSYYVDEVVPRLGEVDYIGWRMQAYVNGTPLKPTFHSLRYNRWWEDLKGFYRDISHLNPIKRELAICADFRRTDPPEDTGWSDQLRGKVTTESYIDRIMYHYFWTTWDSTWRPGTVNPKRGYVRPQVAHPNFSYHPDSSQGVL